MFVAGTSKNIASRSEIDSGSSDKRLFSAGWVFSLINAVKPDLRGEGGEAWLETTYLSPTMRCGRGNKGSVFVLEKAEDPCALDPAVF